MNTSIILCSGSSRPPYSWFRNISFVSVLPLRRAMSSSMPYSLRVRLTGRPAISACLASSRTVRSPQGAQDLVARHVGQVQVEEDDIVVVELAEIDAHLAEICRADVEGLRFQHQ